MTIRLSTLPNGLRVITESMPGLGSAAIGVWIAAGSRHEEEAENGVAHFLEHMAFKGTGKRSALAIAEAIEDVGGHLNAYTSREATAYYARVLKEDAPLAFDLIGDILTNAVFAPDEIELERGVILQEIGQALDTPDDVIFDWLQETAYPGQPLGRPILGPAERVRGFSEDDLRRFTARHYAPGSMILSAAGAVDHDALLKEAERQFGHLKPVPVPVRDAAAYRGGERRKVKKLEQAHLAMAFEAPSWRDDGYHAMQLMSVALGGGMSSRLFQEAREKRGLCYTIFAQAGAYQDSGLLTIYAGTGGGEAKALAELTIDVIKEAADTLRQDELDRARAQMRAGIVMGLESPSARAERLARSLMIWGEAPDLEKTMAKIDAVTVADIRAAAARLANPTLAWYGPVKTAPGLDALTARLAA
ncbi:insulinase family protein [Pikeienuella piscinae]|uniref:Insulinase family protein n=1 Tax=Pikeienuella piscinae TaxID=2748098 RepID=A0A7M3T5D0_9RHOB|nr:pitrilysin family protein [Pikeienuella piscinae]QIE57211.1 insulinase family protein [Pikeienuella piscinae]